MQTVTRLYRDTETVIEPLPGSALPVSPMISWAPQVVFSPGYFSHNGLVYDLRQPGLYRLWNPMVNTTQMLVYGGDPFALLSGAAWLTTFGDDDRRQAAETTTQFMNRLQGKAYTSKLQLLCGDTVQFTRERILGSLVSHRAVHVLTIEPFNNVVDGHICVELALPSGMVFADVSLNTLFSDGSGNYLSAKDAIPAIAAGTCVYEPLADDGYAVEPAVNYQFDSTGYAERELRTPAQRAAWRHRIFQAVGMWNGAELWWKLPPNAQPGDAARIEALDPPYKVKSASLWDATFYP